MTPDLKKLLAASLLSALGGALATFAFVWRDVAVIHAELAHIRADLQLVQTFVASDDPKAWLAAKARIKAHRAEGEDGQ